MAVKHEAFSQTEEANGLQFLLTMEVLPLINLKIGSTCQDSVKCDNQYCFQLLEATMYGSRKWLQTSRNHLVSCGQVLKLFQPSYTLFTQITPLLLP